MVRALDAKVKPRGTDLDFASGYTITSTDDHGGALLTDVEVILCFWGKAWSRTPLPSPSSDDYKNAIIGILTGPYLGGLRQYRNVGQGTLLYSEINDSSDPKTTYSNSDVTAMLTDRIANHGMPAPTSGHNRFYVVIAPTGFANSSSFVGQHQSFTYNSVTAAYAWVDNPNTLTGSTSFTKVFSHELVEACTNPNVDTSNDGIRVRGTNLDGSSFGGEDEIGDACNGEYTTVDMNGIQCSVQSYWSKADNACILPLGRIAFWVDKSTFGPDETKDVINTNSGKWANAFWLVVDGFSKDAFAALHVSVATPDGSFAALAGVTITPNGQIEYENGVASNVPQRIRIGFDIVLTAALTFPTSGTQTYTLHCALETDGNTVPSSDTYTEFELVSGSDPYFTNVDPSQDNVYYLSQDLRVFSATPKLNSTPVPGGPSFSTESSTDAYAYLQALLNWLNQSYSAPSGVDPFASVLPAQSGAYQGDSSVSPTTLEIGWPFNINLYQNYAFAIARVRLRGSSGAAGAAKGVRVFFRLWATQSTDADYQMGSTYPSSPDPNMQPGSPQVGSGHVTLPFFASGDLNANTDYATNGVNIHDITIPTNDDSVWKYYGCFLNLYDPNNIVDGKPVQAWLTGTHHCLVAQIAYDGAPINPGATPEASDKLAQRNLQVTVSDNPGPAAGHRIPQTFDLRPSATASDRAVDQLMIDWGRVPIGSTASIYWPQLPAAEVIALAADLYRSHPLTAADPHTIQVKVNGGVTYVPIPKRSGDNIAGLLTLELPTTVTTGEEFDVVVRRIAERRTSTEAVHAARPKTTAAIRPAIWRYVVGTFQVKIPIANSATMLRSEEDTARDHAVASTTTAPSQSLASRPHTLRQLPRRSRLRARRRPGDDTAVNVRRTRVHHQRTRRGRVRRHRVRSPLRLSRSLRRLRPLGVLYHPAVSHSRTRRR